MDAPEGTPRASAPTPARTGLHAARLRCEICGETTEHRILHWDRRAGERAAPRAGLARCRVCGWTHPFEVRAPEEHELDLIVSRGAGSERSRVRLPAHEELSVGAPLPVGAEALRIHRLSGRRGGSLARARAEELTTVWTTPANELRLKVSLVAGAHTRSTVWVVAPDAPIAIGQVAPTEIGEVRVTGLRANGRTWRFPDEVFPAREVQRVYARRMVTPPAGNRDWRSEREIPQSRASSTSRAGRSRSSPGVRRTRTAPRRRTASAGATVQRSSPS